ncbi:pyruvate dehydrogenase protein X component, mitochondrial-like [Neocloeon triangulifer]|uniref:pyruvate dehydrogenase protein X component, mitochondrial-like n=1 Tax=Neocloeon triangulifer TaxID=2078957 RepID=UPI00286F28C7|nr:pyruvate dehydrogenase protein X component, mitochondrial-like [Neocloeon triangulifer]
MAAALTGRLGRQVTNKLIPTLLQPKIRFRIKLEHGFRHSPALFVVGAEIKMPSLSPTMAEGTIVKWMKKEGDPIAAGDVLCDIQTDKAIVSFETEEEGILAKILIGDDAKDIKVGTLIALMVAEGENWKDVEMPAADAAPSSSSETQPAASQSSQTASSATKHSVGHAGIQGPAVHRLLQQFGLDASDVPATGPKGNLLKGDILNLVNQKGLKPKPPQTVSLPAAAKPTAAAVSVAPASKARQPAKSGSKFVDVELTSMRKTIAKRLSQSKSTIPHSYGSIDCDISEVLRLRKVLKSEGIATSVNDFIIKGVATALRQYPNINCIWNGEQAVPVPDVDVSIAVATDTGLITPIVKKASDKGVQEISAVVRDLAARAKQGKLQLNEFQGGSFTISNLGMFGINFFSAIINPPQCSILAVGAGRLILGSDGKPVQSMCVTLSYDRRAIDEEQAAEFLAGLRDILEDPSRMILGGVPSSIKARVGI